MLAYHRVVEFDHPGFDTFRRNVSATPGEFQQQMGYVAARFNPIALDEVLAAASGGPQLPDRPLLITFDDGYRDNLTAALPIAERHGVPLTVFLASDHIGTGLPFYWDEAAYAFCHTRLDHADLPGAGPQSWRDAQDRERVLGEWIERLKTLPDELKEEAVGLGIARLDVSVPDDAFASVYLSWDEARAMADRGVSFGAHTMRHPILTRITPERVGAEVTGSQERIEREVGRPVSAFAYPNGQAADVSPEVTGIVAAAGIQMAFTLLPGPSRPREVGDAPLMVRRIYIHHGDHPSRFAAKVMGVSRLARGLG